MQRLLARLLVLPLLATVLAASDAVRDGRREQTAREPVRDALPLEPTRTISFTTDEGTWMSLDVSPDGHTIVFDLVGDLYTLPIAGGQATRITEGPAFDGQPRYSPDGQTIVFVSDRSGAENLWLIDRDGKNPRALTRGDNNQYISPEWTPDGNYLVVSRNTTSFSSLGFDLYLYHRGGGAGVKLAITPPFDNCLGVAFGPDPRFFYVAVKRGGAYGYNMQFPSFQVAVFDRETGRATTRTTAYGSAMRPVVSPSGEYLVYATRHDSRTALKVRNLVTDEERWLATDVQRDDQEGSRFTRDTMPGSAFTPDGRALITSYGGKLWRLAVPSGEAAPIPFTAEIKQHLGPLAKFEYVRDDANLTVQQIREPRLAPDGKRVVFTALDKLWVMDLPDGTPRRVTPATGAGEFYPVWSPDGRDIAYVTWTEKGGDVYRVAVEGGQPKRLSMRTAYYERLNYTPDGTKLVVGRGSRQQRIEGRGFTNELVWLPADGGEATLIAPMRLGGWPHFTSDGTRLYINEGGEGLVSMRFDGTDRTPVIKVTGYAPPGGSAAGADEVLISPDGKRVLAQVADNVYLIDVPMAGGQTPTISVTNPANAAVPVKRITGVGGDFIAWRGDGRAFSYALGRSLFVYEFAGSEAIARGPAYAPSRVDVKIVVPRDTPSGTVVLRGGRIIVMKPTGATPRPLSPGGHNDDVIENGDVVVTGNRIAAVGPRGKVALPTGARIIDVSGKTIIPGWIDLHAHTDPPVDVHRHQVWEYLAYLAYGVTTNRNPQSHGTDILSYADLVETGEILGPRLFTTGTGLMMRDNLRSLDDVRDVLRRYAEYYNTQMLKQYDGGDRRVRQWIIMAANELRLTATTEGALDAKKKLTEVLDGYPGGEHFFPIVPLYKDVVELIARAGSTQTPTLITSIGGPFAEESFFQKYDIHEDQKLRRFMPHGELDRKALRRTAWFREDQHVYRLQAEQAAKLVAAGGRVGMGAHGQLHGLGCHWELWMIASGGMPLHDVLRVGTIFGAEAIGMARDLGSVEPGKLADLQVLDANPLVDIRNTNTIRYVMKNGRLYEADTLTEIWPRHKALDRPWWWDYDPPSPGSTGSKGRQ